MSFVSHLCHHRDQISDQSILRNDLFWLKFWYSLSCQGQVGIWRVREIVTLCPQSGTVFYGMVVPIVIRTFLPQPGQSRDSHTESEKVLFWGILYLIGYTIKISQNISQCCWFVFNSKQRDKEKKFSRRASETVDPSREAAFTVSSGVSVAAGRKEDEWLLFGSWNHG